MQTDEHIEHILDNEFSNYWQLIIGNNTETLIGEIQPIESPGKKKSYFSFLKPQKVENEHRIDKLHLIIYELFTENASRTLDEAEFKIMDPLSIKLFENLVRLLFAVKLNGKHDTIREIVETKLYNATSLIADNVEKEANGYPNGSINGQVWSGGAIMREAFDTLGYYYMKNDLIKSQLWVQRMRTRITLSIMPHYPHLVFPDVLYMGEIEEQLDLKNDALQRYEAIIADFEQGDMMEWLMEDLNHIPEEPDRLTMETVIKAYKRKDRIKNTNDFDEQVEKIEAMLKR